MRCSLRGTGFGLAACLATAACVGAAGADAGAPDPAGETDAVSIAGGNDLPDADTFVAPDLAACTGTPAPGEVCGVHGWECQPDQVANVWAGCPALLCAGCDGFPHARTVGQCACACSGGSVRCVLNTINQDDLAGGADTVGFDDPGPAPVDAGETGVKADTTTEDHGGGVPDVPAEAADVPATDAAPEAVTDGAGDTGFPSVLTLDPKTIAFGLMPIDSIRGQVTGMDPAAGACVTLVWDYSNLGKRMGAHCDDFGDGFPYVVVRAAVGGACPAGQVDYGTDLATVGATGCVDFRDLSIAGRDLVDVRVDVSGPSYTGTVVADSRHATTPPPVTLGLAYTTDVPEDVWVQAADDYGLPAWVTVTTKDGAPVLLFDRCDGVACTKPAGVCGIAQHQVLDVTGGTYSGAVYLTWDGRARAADGSGCAAAAPGDYVAQFCFGWTLNNAKTDVVQPTCRTQAFTLPADTVILHADYGG